MTIVSELLLLLDDDDAIKNSIISLNAKNNLDAMLAQVTRKE